MVSAKIELEQILQVGDVRHVVVGPHQGEHGVLLLRLASSVMRDQFQSFVPGLLRLGLDQHLHAAGHDPRGGTHTAELGRQRRALLLRPLSDEVQDP